MDAELLQQISELGQRLAEKRAARKELDAEIKKLEEEVRPLALKAQEQFQALLGFASPPAAPNPAPVPSAPSQEELQRQVVGLFKEGNSPEEIAERLRVSALKVRELLAELARTKARLV